MKFRPDSTTSERQLVLAMAGLGKTLSLSELSGWRQDGLLPALASHGLGPGKGKSYYWREADIVPHASAAFDFLAKYGRPDTAILMLWLTGFSVPLPQLRRAWAYRIKTRKVLTVRPAEKFSLSSENCGSLLKFDAGNSNSFLLKVALMLSGAMTQTGDDDGKEIVEILRKALSRLQRANSADAAAQTELAERLWRIVRLLGDALEASGLIRETSETDLRNAQDYLCVAARLLRSCEKPERKAGAAPEPLWSAWLAERMGPPLFLLILVQLRAGNRPMLDELARDIEQTSRQETSPPARIYAAAVRGSSSKSEARMPRSA